MFIRTERLFLRPVFPEDWRAVHRGLADEGIVRMLSRAPWPYLEDDARAFCERMDDPHWPRFAITLPGEPGAPLIGMIGLDEQLDERGAGAELGYWLARDRQRRGIAPEAVAGVLEIAAAIGHERVFAGHFLDNPASGKVLARAGFVETGEIRLMHSAGRGGEAVPARRYVCELTPRARQHQPRLTARAGLGAGPSGPGHARHLRDIAALDGCPTVPFPGMEAGKAICAPLR